MSPSEFWQDFNRKYARENVELRNAEQCCYLDGEQQFCIERAEWIIVSGPRDSDVTYACTKHVGDLLCDAPEHRIYPVER